MKSNIQKLRDKVDGALGELYSKSSFFLKSYLSPSSSPRSLLSQFRHQRTDYDYRRSEGMERETEWLRAKNDLLEILSIINSFKDEILEAKCPLGGDWFAREIDLFNKFDLNELITAIAKEEINPVQIDKTNHKVKLNKSLFIRCITQSYSLKADQIKEWMKSAADQSQFTIEFAQKIIAQWDKYDPEKYGDPFELWDFFSRKAEYEFYDD